MDDTFAATAISRTRRADSTLDIELADAEGRRTVISVPADVALQLARELKDFADSAGHGRGAGLTKRPKSFAVGTGRFENVVLVRFEDDVPYALDVEDATDLGEALLEQSESIGRLPEKILQ